MAYLALTDGAAAAIAPAAPRTLSPAAPKADSPAGFSALEWSVVMLARHDRPASLREPGRVATWLGRIFGGAVGRRLADPRLEALRRMAVLTWHHSYSVPKAELKAFFAAGYSADHYELLGKRVAEVHVARLFR
ncbi:hypothetical protein CVO77_13255 [Sphingopyxis lindanitolerans]|uniref:Uncharacterized protein n=1 Tax=Sphingopyxis lindanitolerans TaxID=2054227 RepID=A0A2S8B173_9SPHN|nr:hypothetical protein [Sphingopyxis lindanitolerans]PQM26058.1 hypothetical protein CVO77_13255 [Sphingopyxis lindanitolerans]